MQRPEQSLLPALRDDLSLLEGASTLNGEARWLIYDPVRHRYFEVDGAAFELISIWQQSVESLRQSAEDRFRRIVSDEELDAIKRFLLSNSLTIMPASGHSSEYDQQARRGHRRWFSRVLHGYLFFRIPLLRPQRALDRYYPSIAWLFARWFQVLTVLAGIAGIYLVSRQWDAFIASFPHFFSYEGVALYVSSLVVIKVLHELGHAFMAARHGVRVPSMGVAFMVLFPVLYSDVTDAWRLKSRKKRLAIAAGGIAVELTIACYATLMWAVLPEGPAKSIAFVLATSSWILSLLINLNPLMRFDGYYLLMDYWGISNLQPRSFAVARWWLREALFGLQHEPPDNFTPAQRSRLVAYAFATWIYRFFLFLGIALAVYHMFFKALGVFLFVVEILFFILLPIMRELEAWWLMRKDIGKTRRTMMTASVAILAAAALVVPWPGTIIVPAVFEAQERADIFAPGTALVENVLVANNDQVAAGDVLVTLGSPELQYRLAIAQKRLHLARQRAARVASGARERGNLRVLEQQVHATEEEIQGLRREIERLVVRAPISGRIVDVSRQLHAGRWVNRTMALARVVSPSKSRIEGLAGEDVLARIGEGSLGHFIPDDIQLAQMPVRVLEISTVGERTIENPYFSSPFGGRIAAELGKDGEAVALHGHHKINFSVDSNAPVEIVRGIVRVDARPESMATAIWRNILRVLVREASA